MRLFLQSGVFLSLSTAVLSSPFHPPYANFTTRNVLQKRTNPILDASFAATDPDTQKVTDGLADAIVIASSAVSDIDGGGPIFAKYFQAADKAIVRQVFMDIMGNPTDPVHPDPSGSTVLGQITITKDTTFMDEGGDLPCADATTMAQLTFWDTPNPTLVICPTAGLGHGNVEKSSNPVTCDGLDPRVSFKMETLGSIFLHEYTHFPVLVKPNLAKETDDDAYGPSAVRAFAAQGATNNADSYSWYANEAFWSAHCAVTFADPIAPTDDNDPLCDSSVCRAPKTGGP